jgi:tight adherence protein C
LFAIWWIGMDAAPLRVVFASAVLVLCFFVPQLVLWNRGQERQEQIQTPLPTHSTR